MMVNLWNDCTKLGFFDKGQDILQYSVIENIEFLYNIGEPWGAVVLHTAITLHAVRMLNFSHFQRLKSIQNGLSLPRKKTGHHEKYSICGRMPQLLLYTY